MVTTQTGGHRYSRDIILTTYPDYPFVGHTLEYRPA